MMKSFRIIWRWLRSLGQRRAVKQDIDEELRFHIEQRTAENIATGMAPEEAGREARKRFGNVQSVREECREARGVNFGEEAWQDIRFGFRMLVKNRSFTVLSALMLALGTGGTAALAIVCHGILLKPLPYERPGQLVMINEKAGHVVVPSGVFSDWKENSTSFEGMSMLRAFGMSFTRHGEPQRAVVWEVSGDLLDVLGIRPRFGRGFLADEDKPGGDGRIALVTESFVRRAFGGETNVSGRTIRLNNELYSVIGVLASDALVMGEPDVLVPLVLKPGMRDNRDAARFSVWGRLKPGVTTRQAEVELGTIQERLQSLYPKERADWHPALIPLQSWMFRSVKPTLLMLLGAALCVLLIACVNVAGLFLARATTRQKEMALRAALGAGRGRIVRQWLTESALLGLLGGGLGTMMAYWGVKLLLPLLGEMGSQQSLNWAVDLDWRILLVPLLLSLTTGTLIGLVPAVTASAPDLNQALKETARTLAGRSRHRIRDGLLVFEIALAFMLLMVVGLFLKSIAGKLNEPLGYEPEKVMALDVSLPPGKYPDEAARTRFFQEVFERLAAQPGIEAVATTMTLPIGFSHGGQVMVEGRRDQPENGYQCHYDVVRGGYMKAMGIPVRRGRDLTGSDFAANAAPVCLVDEALARRLFAQEEVIGRRLRMSGTVYEVVGIVGNARHEDLFDKIVPVGRLYLSQGLAGATPWLIVRSSHWPKSHSGMVCREIRKIDPDQTLTQLGTLQDDIFKRTASQRLMLKLLGPWTGLAVLLAAIGLYGVLAYEVSQRTNEIGIRMALGAQRADVLKLVLRKGMLLTLLGVVMGIAAALATQRMIQSQLYYAKATDPLVLAAALAALLLVALVACWVPARRAASVDPMQALRHE